MSQIDQKIDTATPNTFDCTLVKYAVLWSNKIMWGLDCDVEALLQEMYKLYSYSKVTNSLETANECETQIPLRLRQKIEQYKKALLNKQTLFCRNC